MSWPLSEHNAKETLDTKNQYGYSLCLRRPPFRVAAQDERIFMSSFTQFIAGHRYLTLILSAVIALLLVAALIIPTRVHAALKVGDTAPDFSTQGALAGKEFPFILNKALKKGPVVLYFFPKVFTQGCTIEAHQFAEATAEFTKLNATIIGVSADPIAEVTRFSTEACRSKFAVAVATPEMIKAYNTALIGTMSNRTSYVIAPNHKIIYVYSAMSAEGHVKNTLEAVQKYHAAHGKA